MILDYNVRSDCQLPFYDHSLCQDRLLHTTRKMGNQPETR